MREGGKGLKKEKSAFLLYFCNYRNMKRPDPLLVTRCADRFAALGAEPRLQIVRLLLSAHPTGMVAGEIQEELGIPASTLSHHLERLRQVDVVSVRRVGTFLWYTASTDALREVLGFLMKSAARGIAPFPRKTSCKLRGEKENMSDIQNAVKEKYGAAAKQVAAGKTACWGGGAELSGCDPITRNLYDTSEEAELPADAVAASLGCGTQLAIQEEFDRIGRA